MKKKIVFMFMLVVMASSGCSKQDVISIIDTVKEHFKETAFYALKETRFELATLGNDAGMYGCMAMLLNFPKMSYYPYFFLLNP